MHKNPQPGSLEPTGEAFVHAVIAQVHASADLETGAAALLDAIHGQLDVTGGLVALRDGNVGRVFASVGLPPEWLVTWSQPSESDEARWRAGLCQEPLDAPEPAIDLRLKRSGVRGVLTIPLVVSGGTVGAIVLTSTKAEPFADPEYLPLASIAEPFVKWLVSKLPPPREPVAVVEKEAPRTTQPATPLSDSLATSIGAMAVATLDSDGRFRDVGASFAKLVGVSEDDLRGVGLDEVLAAEDASRARAAIDVTRERAATVLPSVTRRLDPFGDTEGTTTIDLILSRRDESSIVVLGLPVVDVLAAAGDEAPAEPSDESGGLRSPASGVMILDRRKIETSSQWRRWSGELLAVLGGSTLVLDPRGRIVELGSEWLSETEPDSFHWLGRHLGDLFEEDRIEVQEALKTVVRDGVWSGRLTAGTSVPVYLRSVRDDGGALEAIVGARLPEKSLEGGDLFRKIPVGMIHVDPELQIMDTNPELAAVLLGCPRDASLKGVDVRSLAAFQASHVQEALESLPERRRFDLSEVHLEEDANGQPQAPSPSPVVQLHAQELNDGDGEPVGFLITVIGRDGKTQLENRLIEAQKMESIGNFASGLAHDFGNFVSFILGKAKALRETLADNPRAARDLADIEEAGKRAQHLSEELIRFARGGRSRASKLELNDLIKEVVALIKTSVGTNIDVKYELAEGLAPVEGDEVELQQMVLNLCLNARDAMKGGGTLSMQTTPLTPEQMDLLGTGAPVSSGICLVIKDTGVGMPAEIRDHIFEPFFSTKDDQRNGLGLAMVYAIVRRHGGMIDVRSEPGEGTLFEVLLPAATDAVPVSTKKAQVLVVDDELAFREMIRLILEEEGHQVCLAKDGAEALTVLEADHDEIGLVILDLRMPGVDGLSVLQQMKYVAPELPVLVTTGWAEPHELELAQRRGARKILQKPYRAGELRQAIAKVLASEAGEVAPGDAVEAEAEAVPVGATIEDGVVGGPEDGQVRAQRRWSGIVSRPVLGGARRGAAAAGDAGDAANGEDRGGDGPAAIDNEGPVG